MSRLWRRCAAGRRWGVLAALPFMAGLTACASTYSGSLVNEWSDPTYPVARMHTMLVISVNKDSARRHIREDAFVAELSKHGVTATPSYALFPNAIPDTAAVMAAARAHGYDGVLDAYKLPTQTTLVDVPPVVVSSGGGRYGAALQMGGGYSQADSIVQHQIDLWVPSGSGRMIWSAVGESLDPRSRAQIDHEIAADVIPALVRRGVIAK